jgi:hypothetical protein
MDGQAGGPNLDSEAVDEAIEVAPWAGATVLAVQPIPYAVDPDSLLILSSMEAPAPTGLVRPATPAQSLGSP